MRVQALVTMSGFESLGLAGWLVRQVSAVGFREPTPIQTHCIPPVLEGKTSYSWTYLDIYISYSYLSPNLNGPLVYASYVDGWAIIIIH